MIINCLKINYHFKIKHNKLNFLAIAYKDGNINKFMNRVHLLENQSSFSTEKPLLFVSIS